MVAPDRSLSPQELEELEEDIWKRIESRVEKDESGEPWDDPLQQLLSLFEEEMKAKWNSRDRRGTSSTLHEWDNDLQQVIVEMQKFLNEETSEETEPIEELPCARQPLRKFCKWAFEKVRKSEKKNKEDPADLAFYGEKMAAARENLVISMCFQPNRVDDLSEYEFYGFVDEDRFGRNYTLVDKEQEFCRLMVRARSLDIPCKKRMHWEKGLLFSFEHPSIIGVRHAFYDDQNFYLILEHPHFGDFSRVKKLKGELLKLCTAQLILGIEYIHRCNILHRDLRPDSIFIAANGYIKIGNFTSSCLFNRV